MEPSSGTRRIGWRDGVFAATVLLSAWLLFQVQPLVGKRILPWYGGGPAVWTTALLFFQAALLAGYLYAHVIATWLRPRGQAAVHTLLLAAAGALLASRGILATDAWKPGVSEQPQWGILAVLVAFVGLPYVLLSATAPLVQSWWRRTHEAGSPYRLYALSNAGSLAGLLSYPLAMEPALGLVMQGAVWAGLFGAFAVLCVGSAWVGGGAGTQAAADLGKAEGHEAKTPATVDHDEAKTQADGQSTRLIDRVLWIALPACGSALLLAVTNYLCQDVASLPLLWVAPLSIYLVTFIIAFDADRWYVRWAWMSAFAMFAFAAALTWIWDTVVPLSWQVVASLGLLLTGAMVCHGEAAGLRPHASRLTSFYLSLSLGGVLGGLFVAIVAPLAFNDFYELPATLWAAWTLAMVVLAADPASPLFRGRRLYWWSGLAVAWSALTLLMAAPYVRPSAATLAKARDFFGVLKVSQRPTKNGVVRTLVNGRINHGAQFEAISRRRDATTYYAPDSGVGVLLGGPVGTPRRVGVVGLGTGTIAAYAEPLDVFRFYDINPLAVDFAEDYFTFLEDARRRGAEIEIALGDARLSLEQEADQQFDVLALDAFSGDAIPVHLLTREAFGIYLRHLKKPSGVLVVHISNRHLDLKPVVLAAALEYGLKAYVTESEDKAADARLTSTWALLYQPGHSPRRTPVGELLFASDSVRPIEWTDDYSSIVKILKRDE